MRHKHALNAHAHAHTLTHAHATRTAPQQANAHKLGQVGIVDSGHPRCTRCTELVWSWIYTRQPSKIRAGDLDATT